MPNDLFSKLKRLFVIEEDIPKSSEVKPKDSQAEVKQDVKPVYRPPIMTKDGAVDQKYLEILFKALEDNNPEGFDYLEFKEALNSLESVDMDADTRIKSALAVAKTMGADPDSLINSANRYLQILAEEEQKFQDALDGQVEQKLSAKDEAIKTMQEDIDRKQAEIKSLQDQISSLEEETKRKEEELSDATQRLQTVHKDFDSTYNFLYSQIQKDIQLLEETKNQL